MRHNYHVVWCLFSQFYFKLDVKPVAWENHIVLFAGYLINKGWKPATVHSYMLALKFVLLEDKIKISEDRFLLNSLICACKYRGNHSVKLRLPIQKDLLHAILDQVHTIFMCDSNQPYLNTLYQTMFIMAYYGLFHIGEVAFGSHVILARDVHVGTNKKKLLFMLRSSKTHRESDFQQTVKIKSSNIKGQTRCHINTYCPYNMLREFVKLRGKFKDSNEPFFIYRDRSPVTTYSATKTLKLALRKRGFDENNYTFHSLRSGRCVDLLHSGISVETIKKIRRWRSNAIFRYLRQS